MLRSLLWLSNFQSIRSTALYEKLGSKPLDSYVTYNVYPTNVGTTPSPLTPQDVLDCVSTFTGDELAQERQFDTLSSKLLVKTCQKLQLVKALDPSLGLVSENTQTAAPREVAAGFREGPDDSITLWVVAGHENMNTEYVMSISIITDADLVA